MSYGNKSYGTFLITEDDPLDFKLFERALQKAGSEHPYEYLESGLELLEYLEAWKPGQPIIRTIFLDLKMPGMNGLEVLKQIREMPKTRLIPVVILTASMLPSDLEMAYQYGVNGFVVKAMDRHEFMASVQHMVDFWGTTNQVTVQRN